MPGTDDLASLLTAAPSAGMRYGQGQIIQWDPETFENVILWNGQPLENLPIVGTTDALSYQPGQYVALHGLDASGEKGATQWWIAGRILVPGSDNAEQIVDFLRGSLAREIAAQVFVDRIHSVYDATNAQRTSDSFGDPTTGTAGPSVTDVEIVTGSALIILSAGIEFSTSNSAATGTPRVGGLVGVEIAGASSVTPDTSRGIFAQSFKSRSGGAISLVDGIINVTGASSVYLQTGLNPGVHTFTLKYRKAGPTTDYVNVDQRLLTVMAF